ncbi:hypothetical protein BAE44_0003712, partial [Dichanthelium oligosanthes]
MDGVKLPEGVRRTWKDEALSSWLANWRGDLSVMLFDRVHFSWEPLPVSGPKVGTRHMNLQQWVKQHLRDDSRLDIRIRDLLPRKPIAVSGAGFSRLESLYVDSRLPRVTFQPGAMPKLKHLEFKFYAGLAFDEPMGITHLCGLQKVVFRSSQSDVPGISTTIAVVRKEAEEHRN